MQSAKNWAALKNGSNKSFVRLLGKQIKDCASPELVSG